MEDALIQPLPNLSSNVLEFGVYLLGAIVLVHALRRSRWEGMVLVTAVICGFLLEWTNIRTSNTYFYGHFHWMLASWPDWVPACIAIAWACIVYSVMRTTEHLPLSRAQRPLTCALLALMIDLALDPVAADSRITDHVFEPCLLPTFRAGDAPGLHFWTWCVTAKYDTYTWYGIPLSNFFGWMAAIYGYTTAILFVEARWQPRSLGLARQLACLVALVVVAAVVTYAILGLYGQLAFHSGMPGWLLFAFGAAAPLIVTIQMIPRVRRDAAPEWIPFAVPVFVFAFCAWALFATDERQLKEATYAWTLATVTPIGLYLYWLPYRLWAQSS
jgi:hypothetical protein